MTTLSAITIEIDGERVSLERLVAAWRKLHPPKRKANGKTAPKEQLFDWAGKMATGGFRKAGAASRRNGGT